MDYLKAFYALIPLIIAVIVHAYKDAFLAVIRAKTITDFEIPPSKQLVISVISARGNFVKRQAIRDTWWRYTKDRLTSDGENGTELKFVVGQPCLIHPEFRRDEHSCHEWITSLPDYFEDIPIFVQHPLQAPLESLSSGGPPGRNSFSFRVHHTVVISKLGLHVSCVRKSEPVIVKLIDAVTNTEIVSATFTKDSPGVLIQGYLYKPVESYVLSRGYEGIIAVTKSEELWPTNNGISVSQFSRVNTNTSGVIELYNEDSVVDGHYRENAYHTDLNTLSSFLYNIHDVEAVRAHINNKENKTVMWAEEVKREQLKLQLESEEYDDLLFVTTTDVYRNVTEKLLQAIQHFTRYSFHYFLKTDDDTFIDIDGILQEWPLKHYTWSWMGQFRHNWAVEHFGKWAERSYHSLTYPPFACGSAYILSKDIVDWIAENSDRLKRFQGEDVSLGIWLSGVEVSREDSPRWQCSGDCVPGVFSLPQLSPHQLRHMWHNWRTYSNSCKC